MLTFSLKHARSNLSRILDLVEKGEEIIITRRNKKIAHIESAYPKARKVPSLKSFRKKITYSGAPFSKVISAMRDEERY
jgi:prevent-host-death family protein